MAIYMNPSGPDRWSRVKRPLFILSVLMYMFCSIHFALQFAHFYTALVCAMPHSRATRPLNTTPEYRGRRGIFNRDKRWPCHRTRHDIRGFHG